MGNRKTEPIGTIYLTNYPELRLLTESIEILNLKSTNKGKPGYSLPP